MANEGLWRLGLFLAILVIMMAFEWRFPARKTPTKLLSRWAVNFSLVVISSVIARLAIPFGLTAVALYAKQHGIGLFNQTEWPWFVIVILSVVLLDLVIYWQHRLFHQIPVLWRLHRVHHADPHIDASTGLRFHPLEIVLSIVVKIGIVLGLGVPPSAVLIFEIALNGFALFNHANIRLPAPIEKYLRCIIVTQTLHRIHHSQIISETNSNYGFSVIWWDKLFSTFKSAGTKSDTELDIGLIEYQQPKQHTTLWGVLTMPFRK